MEEASRQPRSWATSVLWALLTLATMVTLATWITGGFRVDPFGLRVSSTFVWRPLALAAIAGLLLARDQRQLTMLCRLLARYVLPVSVVACAGFVWTHAAPVAAAADMFGYVSQANDWRQGTLIRHDWIDGRFFPAAASVPLGYLYRHDTVPVAVALYPPGTSLHMAVFSLVGQWAVYLVSPMAALALVFGTYALGRAWFDEASALVAAAIIACNPVVLIQAAVPMSDTLAAAYWTWSLVLASSGRSLMPIASGLLAGMAIVVRPNLAPLLIGPVGGALVASGLRGAVVVSAAAMPFAALLAWHNQRLYGGAAATGYGPLSTLFSASHVAENVKRYVAWLWQTMSPLPLVGALLGAVEVVVRAHVRLIPLVAFTAVNVAIYLVYLPWPQWTFARFLLPALPVMVLLAASAARRATARWPIVFPMLVVVVIGWQIDFAQRSELRTSHESLMRFKTLPEAMRREGLVGRPAISRVHSGSLRHYAGIATVRWDVISPDELRRGIIAATAAGQVPLLVDDSEDRAEFEQRFGPIACWGDVATPVLELQHHATIRVLTARPGC